MYKRSSDIKSIVHQDGTLYTWQGDLGYQPVTPQNALAFADANPLVKFVFEKAIGFSSMRNFLTNSTRKGAHTDVRKMQRLLDQNPQVKSFFDIQVREGVRRLGGVNPWERDATTPDINNAKNSVDEDERKQKPSQFHTEEGKLTETIKVFLENALKVDRQGLDDTIWTAYSQFDGALWQNVAAWGALVYQKGFEAITLGKDVVFKDELVGNGSSDWLRSIVHEQSHIQQYIDRGTFGFIQKYFFETNEFEYSTDPTERFAYLTEYAFRDWLRLNPETTTLLEKDWSTLSENEKAQVEQSGKQFRYEAGIDAEISFWTEWSQQVLEQIDSIQNNIPTSERTNEIVKGYERILESYREQIADLQLEKEMLRNELGL